MKVKLKSMREIERAGFKFVGPIADCELSSLFTLVRPDGASVILDLHVSNELEVAPRNSIPEEVFLAFKPCFEVIE